MLNLIIVGLVTLGQPFAVDSLSGEWEGELLYRDYQSDQLIGIPMRVSASLHGGALIQQITWTDPGFEVYSTVLSQWDEETQILQRVSERDGRFELLRLSGEPLEVVEGGWSIRLSYEGSDDGAPAMIREVMTVTEDGVGFALEKMVNPAGDGVEEYLFRNRVELRRVEDRSAD